METEIEQALKMALSSKNTDDYAPHVWARMAVVLAREVVNLRARQEAQGKQPKPEDYKGEGTS